MITDLCLAGYIVLLSEGLSFSKRMTEVNDSRSITGYWQSNERWQTHTQTKYWPQLLTNKNHDLCLSLSSWRLVEYTLCTLPSVFIWTTLLHSDFRAICIMCVPVRNAKYQAQSIW